MGMSMALVGGASALAGMFGGGKASDVQLPPQWNMPNRDAAAGGAFSGIQGMQPWTDLGMQTMPFAQNIFEQQFYNPYASMYQSGAGGASGLGMNAALNQYRAGGQLMLFGGQAINTGFDPRSALYNRSLQQTQEQLRAGVEAVVRLLAWAAACRQAPRASSCKLPVCSTRFLARSAGGRIRRLVSFSDSLVR